MSLLVLSIEYLLLSVVFETIRQSSEKSLKEQSLSNDILKKWKPLSDEEILNIRKLTK